MTKQATEAPVDVVARAIDPVINAALDEHFGGSWESPEWAAWVEKIADAAISAIDALPSEAMAKAAYEVEAAQYDIDMRWDELSERERAQRIGERIVIRPDADGAEFDYIDRVGVRLLIHRHATGEVDVCVSSAVTGSAVRLSDAAAAYLGGFMRSRAAAPAEPSTSVSDADMQAAFGAAWHAWEANNDGSKDSENLLYLSVQAAMRTILRPNPLADIEPTEEELEATQQRWDKAFEDICKLPNDQLPDDPFRESLRAALTYFIAMRKADAATAVVAAHQTVRSDSVEAAIVAAAQARYESVATWPGSVPWDNLPEQIQGEHIRATADIAAFILAALDACQSEPTEAEVEAAWDAFAKVSARILPDQAISADAKPSMRAALIAARNAGEGEG